MAVTATMYAGTFHGRPDQVRRARAAVARYLDGCPAADDAVLVVSEIASNSVLHSRSGGEFFAIRCQLYPDYAWDRVRRSRRRLAPQAAGRASPRLDVVEALAGPNGWAPRRPATATALSGSGSTWLAASPGCSAATSAPEGTMSRRAAQVSVSSRRVTM